MQRIHGLAVQSSPPLPGLMEDCSGSHADLVLTVADALGPPVEPSVERYRSRHGEDHEATLRIVDDARGLTCFRYADGTAIDVDCSSRPVRATATVGNGQTLEDLTVYLVGPVFGLVLRVLGVLALHASAVVVDGKAVLLLGDSGAGKSTTAAALALQGQQVLSDDLTALAFGAEGVLAHPAFDHLRIWPESEPLLFGESGKLERITPTWEKLRFDIPGGGQPVPVGAIVNLVVRDEVLPSAPLAAPEAILTLARNSYSNYTLTERTRAIELKQIGELVNRVPIFRMARTPEMTPAQMSTAITTLAKG